MSVIAPAPYVADSLPVVVPPHLLESFEKADRQLRELYGDGPGVPALVRMWLACGTPSGIRREFEMAVLDLQDSDITPNGEGDYDEGCL